MATTLSAPEAILSSTLADIELEVGSIPSEWVLSGQPETRSKLARVQALMKELRAAVALPKRREPVPLYGLDA